MTRTPGVRRAPRSAPDLARNHDNGGRARRPCRTGSSSRPPLLQIMAALKPTFAAALYRRLLVVRVETGQLSERASV